MVTATWKPVGASGLPGRVLPQPSGTGMMPPAPHRAPGPATVLDDQRHGAEREGGQTPRSRQ